MRKFIYSILVYWCSVSMVIGVSRGVIYLLYTGVLCLASCGVVP